MFLWEVLALLHSKPVQAAAKPQDSFEVTAEYPVLIPLKSF
jgi:hypothetical protein